MMEFKRLGKSYQVVINNGADLQEILALDEALWGATSAPASVFKTDPAFIALLDTNKNGRINTNDVKASIQWFLAQINNPADFTIDFDGNFKLDSLKETSSSLKASAQYILKELNASSNNAITLDQIREFIKTVSQRSFNGDGVISLRGAEETAPFLLAIVKDTVATMGGSKDADGTQGATEQDIINFIATAKDYLAWVDAGALAPNQQKSDILPFGQDTAARAAAFKAIEAPIDQFFKLSGLLGFDGRIKANALAPETKVGSFDPADTAKVDEYLAGLPLAQPTADSKLTISLAEINPLYRKAFNVFVETIVKPILGENTVALTPETWDGIKAVFAPYFAYMAAKKGTAVESLPIQTLRDYVANTELPGLTAITGEKDKKVSSILADAHEVEKLLLYCTYLVRFANNYINFSELYNMEKRAMFECGSLVIDGRWFKLAFNVDNVAAHQALAKNSLLCTLYVEVTMDGGVKKNIVVPVTSGSQGNLAVGKRGVFFALDGKEYDAVVSQIIVNPVCVREALLAPFVKMRSMVEGKIENWSGSSEKSLTSGFDKALEDSKKLGDKPAPKPAEPAKPADKSGMLLGVSVAVAALGSAFAFISNTLAKMSSSAIWITVICAILVLLAPITLMAIVKLRKQDLSSLLEGSGWAINLRMRLTSRLRGQFTKKGVFPKDAKGTPRGHWLFTILFIVIIVAGIYYACLYIRNTDWGKEQLGEVPPPATAPAAPAPAADAPATPAPAAK